MIFLRLFTLLALLCCVSCSDAKSGLHTLHGQWTCDGYASVSLIPSASAMHPLDRLLTARLYNDMSIAIDANERVITLNLGTRKGKQPFALLHDEGGAVHLMAEDLLSFELRDDGGILVFDPMDVQKKMVFRRM